MLLEGICFPDVSSWLYYLCPNLVGSIWQNNKWEQITGIVILSFRCIILCSEIICARQMIIRGGKNIKELLFSEMLQKNAER